MAARKTSEQRLAEFWARKARREEKQQALRKKQQELEEKTEDQRFGKRYGRYSPKKSWERSIVRYVAETLSWPTVSATWVIARRAL